jgi:hypothetical protein
VRILLPFDHGLSTWIGRGSVACLVLAVV